MTERPNFFTNVRNGWEKLKNRFGIIKQETQLEVQIIRDVAEEAKDRSAPVVELAKNVWANSGSNFIERLTNTVRIAGERIRDGWNNLREVIGERVDNIRERYRNKGVVGATAGIVAEAIQTVGELPDRLGVALNGARATIEEIKLSYIDNKQSEIKSGQNDGWEDQFAQLNLTRNHVENRKKTFVERFNRCQQRLEAMRQGRGKLVEAKQQTVVLQSLPEAE